MSFLANGNANGVAWAPDGTFLLFDTGQRTEVVAARARRPDPADAEVPRGSVPGSVQRRAERRRTPATGRQRRRPTRSRRSRRRPPAARDDGDGREDAAKPVEIVFDDIRQRLSLIPTGLDVGEAFISPDGKTVGDDRRRRRPAEPLLVVARRDRARAAGGEAADDDRRARRPTCRSRPTARRSTTSTTAAIQAVTLDKRETARRGGHRRAGRRLREGEDDRLRPGLAAAARQLLRSDFQRRRLGRRRARRSSRTSPARARPTRCAASRR